MAAVCLATMICVAAHADDPEAARRYRMYAEQCLDKAKECRAEATESLRLAEKHEREAERSGRFHNDRSTQLRHVKPNLRKAKQYRQDYERLMRESRQHDDKADYWRRRAEKAAERK